jgi:hypothetical protein
MGKSKTEEEFLVLQSMYREKFGTNYPMVITDDRSLEDHNNIIKKCIENNTPAEEPEYKDGCIY